MKRKEKRKKRDSESGVGRSRWDEVTRNKIRWHVTKAHTSRLSARRIWKGRGVVLLRHTETREHSRTWYANHADLNSKTNWRRTTGQEAPFTSVERNPITRTSTPPNLIIHSQCTTNLCFGWQLTEDVIVCLLGRSHQSSVFFYLYKKA